jgi:hypothetical protein
MTVSSETSSFSRLMLALSPYRGDLVLIGGWAHRLFRLHSLAAPTGFEPLVTLDADLAVPARIPPRQEDLRALLIKNGFGERLLGDAEPPVTRYVLEGDAGFYAEFVTPLTGSGGIRTLEIAGITAQALRYLEILWHRPWSVFLREPEYSVGSRALEVRIANAASYLAQKLLAFGMRPLPDRAKDVLYIHDTLITFGGSLDALRKIWSDHVAPSMHKAWVKRVRQTIADHFGLVSDPVREASRIARESGRPLPAAEIAQVCRTGLANIFR